MKSFAIPKDGTTRSGRTDFGVESKNMSSRDIPLPASIPPKRTTSGNCFDKWHFGAPHDAETSEILFEAKEFLGLQEIAEESR